MTNHPQDATATTPPTEKPLVSVICATYNQVSYIRQTLDGFVCQQTTFPFEVIVHDDASTDGTTTVVKRYEKKFPALIKPVYQPKNIYQNDKKAFNEFYFSICSAPERGKYIAFCEGDDYWIDPLKLQKQVDFLESHPDYSICYTHTAIFHQQENGFAPGGGLRPNLPETSDIYHLAKGNFILTASVMLRNSPRLWKTLSDNIGNNAVGDYMIWMLAAREGKIGKLDDVTAVYRVHAGGEWSGATQTRQWQRMLDLLEGMIGIFHDDDPKVAATLGGQFFSTAVKLGAALANEGRINDSLACFSRAAQHPPQRHCPVCDADVFAFDPLPAYYEAMQSRNGYMFAGKAAEMCNARDYSCPRCGAADRERLYAMFFRDIFATLQEKKATGPFEFLEIAPNAAFARFVKSFPFVNYRSMDRFMAEVDDHFDICDMGGYGDGRFHFIVCSHVLEHIPDDRQALRELHRILNPVGMALIVVPIILELAEDYEDPSKTTAEERWRHFGQNDHVRCYSKNGFVEKLQTAGFTVQQLGVGHFGEERFAKAGIEPQSVLYVVERRAEGKTGEGC
ncbi:MAG: glycosyltransferase [Acidobacteriota bacterium]|nr:glycosyltransferase [Acidobacteriota bacterium]